MHYWKFEKIIAFQFKLFYQLSTNSHIEIAIKHESQISNWIPVNGGVRQDCGLLPFPICKLCECSLKTVKTEMSWWDK